MELHRLAYYPARAQFAGLGAQAATRAIARVAGAHADLRATKKRAHLLRLYGAIPYDARLPSWNRDARTVSLIFRRGVWLSQGAVTLPQPAVREPVNGFLGVDQGVANLAVTNDGAVLPGPAPSGREHRTMTDLNHTGCGLAGHADHIAARNIAVRGVAGWAVVNQPHATGLPSARRDRESRPSASPGGS
ncbi:hypothetical protein [Nonomuraea turkmeniaca]|uniref:hypothetical protein n=1 Tax=Nonomuraea turkmeniaca TaxID=103838 RepID=UPI001B870ADD|nr:hypothetical protein [Nonomuraea turkmeniaca]